MDSVIAASARKRHQGSMVYFMTYLTYTHSRGEPMCSPFFKADTRVSPYIKGFPSSGDTAFIDGQIGL